MKFRLIAFDPATIKTGYAVADCDGSRTDLIAVGLIHLKGTMEQRLGKLHEKVVELYEMYKPDQFTVEDLKINGYTQNLPSKIKVAYAIGVVMAACGANGLPEPTCITATTMRSRWAIKGRGEVKSKLRKAVNKKVQHELAALGYPYGLEKKHEDISDAIGHLVAVAGILRAAEINYA